MTIVTDKSELQKQQEYADSLAEKGFDYGFAVGAAFVESMRNTHYKHTGTALDELVDNSIEAGATQIAIALGYSGKSDAKPDALAVIDDGHGMPSKMLRPAAAWGGTHRHSQDNRTGFGRFGFGLPSASVNQARRFTIYSIVDGGDWYGVTIDLDEIADGKHTDPSGKVHVPEEEQISPPKWVMEHVSKNISSQPFTHGTVVLWEKMDRVKWSTTNGMRTNLLQHFGVMYRNYINQVQLKFDGTKIEPLDPLFITPGARYFDFDEDRAQALEPTKIDVRSKKTGEKVAINVRYALFPHGFFSVDKSKAATDKNANPRFKVSNDFRGINICRMGRQIDVVEHTPWAKLEKFGNDDRYWGLEIDFPAALDEEFTIANSKQGVVMTDRIWDLLREAGVESALKLLRKGVKDAQLANKAKPETPNEPRQSERSMAESTNFKRQKTDGDPVEREKKARENFEQFVKGKSRESGRPEEEVRSEAEADAVKHPYKVEFADHPGAPFYQVTQRGGMKVLEINRSHRFFSDVYAASGADKLMRASLEVLLFSIGESELDALGNQDKTSFYLVEKNAWSERLAVALESLSNFGSDSDADDDAPAAKAA
jgi:Histidine kinase-, DNA gyrase B-, and HSP90-like ATPase